MKIWSISLKFVRLTILALVSTSLSLPVQANSLPLSSQSWDLLYSKATENQEKGNFDHAAFQYSQLINSNPGKVDEQRIQCETNLGEILLSQGEYIRAYQHFELAHDLIVDYQLGNKLAVNILLKSSILMTEAGLDSLAVANLEIAKKNALKEADQQLLLTVLCAQGYNHFIAGRNTACEAVYQEAINSAEETNNPIIIAMAALGLGELLFRMDQTTNATHDGNNFGVHYFEKALKVAQRLNEPEITAKSQVFLGNIHIKNNILDAAYLLCNQAYKRASAFDLLKTKILSCNCLKQIYHTREEWQLAFQMQEEIIQLENLNKNPFSQELSILLFKNALKHMKEQQVYEYRQLETQKIWTTQLLSLQKNRIWILSLFFGASLLLIFILYRLFKTKKQHNAELQALNYQLNSSNHMLEESIEELNQTNETLQQTNKALNNFATVAAHDLKGPLRSIISFSQLLQSKLKNKLGEKEVQYFKYINTSTRKLATLIDDLLDFSRLDGQMPAPVEVDLNIIIKDVITSLQQTIQERDTQFNISKIPTVLANHSLMIQVFQNIISNSLKFAQEGSKIKINAFSLSDNRVQISIRDNGIGIPEDQQEQVFELFTRLNAQDKYEGSGVGLATCRKIVQHYGGKMMISSTEGRGTTVFFDLPLSVGNKKNIHVITINES